MDFFRTVTGADLKNPIEDLAVRVTCDHDNVEFRINLQLECMRARPSERLVGFLCVGGEQNRILTTQYPIVFKFTS